MTEVEGAKLVGGIWLPAGEAHLIAQMAPGAKRHRIIDGKWTFQVHKLERALNRLPEARRRVCLDLGAHCGLWSMHLQRLFGRVVAFEPVPLHRACFAANVTGENVQLLPYALGERAAEVVLHVPDDHSANAHLATERPLSNGAGPVHDVAGVAMRTLDSFHFTEVDFVKIDVEGYERPLIAGARETLVRERPLVIVEQKGNEAHFYGEAPGAALRFLEGLGMRRLDVVSGDHIMGW